MSIEGQGHFLTIYFPGFVCTRPRYQVSVYRTIGSLVINGPGHMTKMATTPIYGKNPSKIFSSGTGGQISMKFGV